MGVPETICTVDRSKNTIVEDSGREGANRYSVRERTGIEYVRNGNPQPGNGKVIGHIINGMLVPVAERMSGIPDSLSYGAAALAKSVSNDIFENLLTVYHADEASEIMVVATLKVLRPRIAANSYSTHYGRLFVSLYYPNAALSKNTVGPVVQEDRQGLGGPPHRHRRHAEAGYQHGERPFLVLLQGTDEGMPGCVGALCI